MTKQELERFINEYGKDIYSFCKQLVLGGAYMFDEESGEIHRNEEYSGLNALFELPLDESKADPEAAAKYIESIQ